MSATDSIELFTALVCPYAHRTRLVLGEKGLDFTLTEIDFKNKPARFLEVSRYGKVPAIVHAGNEVYESAIVNEYLDEVFPEPAMMPVDPGARAQARIWIDYCDGVFLDDVYAAIKNQDESEAEELRTKVVAHFREIDAAMTRLGGGGPFWLGAEISLVDCAYYPFFERLPAWTHYRGIDIPDECVRLRNWRTAMAVRPSVTNMANSPDYYIERYAGYAGAQAAAE